MNFLWLYGGVLNCKTLPGTRISYWVVILYTDLKINVKKILYLHLNPSSFTKNNIQPFQNTFPTYPHFIPTPFPPTFPHQKPTSHQIPPHIETPQPNPNPKPFTISPLSTQDPTQSTQAPNLSLPKFHLLVQFSKLHHLNPNSYLP